VGKDPIESVNEAIAGSALSSDEPSSNRRRKVRTDTGKRCRESRIVHFRQLFQEGGMRLSSLDITGKDEHTARVSGDAGRGGAFSTFPLFMRRYGGRA